MYLGTYLFQLKTKEEPNYGFITYQNRHCLSTALRYTYLPTYKTLSILCRQEGSILGRQLKYLGTYLVPTKCDNLC